MKTPFLQDSDFDIDVQLHPGDRSTPPVLVDSRWYELAVPQQARRPALQAKADGLLQRALWSAQWQAAMQRRDRRRTRRAPILSRVWASHEDAPMTACDISLSGLRCSGRPKKDQFDIELKLPGLAFPVEAQVQVARFKDANVLPLVGLEFVDIEYAYLQHIQHYITRRQARG